MYGRNVIDFYKLKGSVVLSRVDFQLIEGAYWLIQSSIWERWTRSNLVVNDFAEEELLQYVVQQGTIFRHDKWTKKRPPLLKRVSVFSPHYYAENYFAILKPQFYSTSRVPYWIMVSHLKYRWNFTGGIFPSLFVYWFLRLKSWASELNHLRMTKIVSKLSKNLFYISMARPERTGHTCLLRR